MATVDLARSSRRTPALSAGGGVRGSKKFRVSIRLIRFRIGGISHLTHYEGGPVIRSSAITGVLAALMILGLNSEAFSQERVRLQGAASCIDSAGRYVITWTLTLALGDGETATAESIFGGLDLIGQPQGDDYPFVEDAGNIFTAASGRLVNGANVARTPINIRVYNPDTLTASGSILISGASTDVEAVVTRPSACAA
jgi:hypothetical protein